MMEISMAILFLAAIAAYLMWFTVISRPFHGPRVWPFLGCIPAVIANHDCFNDWIAEHLHAFGGTLQNCFSAIPFLLLKQGFVTLTCDPKNIEHILKTHFDNYTKGPIWHAVFYDLLGEMLFNSDGDTWLFQRKTIALQLSMIRKQQTMARWVNQAIKLRFCPMLKTAQEESMIVDLQDLLLRLTFDNICGVTFGKDPQTLSPGLPNNQFTSAFDQVTEAFIQRIILPQFTWKLTKWLRIGKEVNLSQNIHHVKEYILNVIQIRKLELQQNLEAGVLKGDSHDDLLSMFMDKKETEAYSDTFLQNIMIGFILAGRDTTSVALTWFFWLTMLNPEVEEKILHSICTVLMETRGDDMSKWLEEPLVFHELDRLVYLKAALSETLRLYPSVPLDLKHVVADDVLPDGTFVPGGSKIVYSIYSVGRMEWTWGDDCMEFRPERWLSDDGKSYIAHDQFKFVSFNAGPRNCLGKDMAYLQMKSVAAAVLLRHRLTLAPGHRVEQKLGLTLFMKNGMMVHVHHRDLLTTTATIRKEKEGAPIGTVN